MSDRLKARNAALIEHYYRFATVDDEPPTTVAKAALALSHLHWAEQRKPGRAKVRVFNPSDAEHGYSSNHTVIETATDDSPFIVDSLTMQLNAASQGVLVKLHSVFWVERNADGRLRDISATRPSKGKSKARNESLRAESWTHFEIPRIIDAAELAALERKLDAVLKDVKTAVSDWQKMLAKLRHASEDLQRFGDPKHKLHEEARKFLDWLADNHFTLLGYCEIPAKSQAAASKPLGLLRTAKRRDALVRGRRKSGDPITITKSSLRSTVHRPALLDDIRVDAFDAKGRVVGEHRFVGLFASLAYNEYASDIPLLNGKVNEVIRRSKLDPSSHRGKTLRHILDTFPRDELIQIGLDDLERISIGILKIEERRKIRLFYWQSAYGDFYSCIVYLPRDGYSGRARARVESLLSTAFGGTVVDSQLMISESTLARLTLTIHRSDPKAKLPDADALQEKLVAAAASWLDRSRSALLEAFPEDQALALHARLAAGFPVAYQESARAERLSRDFFSIQSILDGKREQRFDLVVDGKRGTFTAILQDNPIPLYVAEPILENMGVLLLQETSHRVEIGTRTIWIQDFVFDLAAHVSLESSDVAK
ncbi:MAG: NAD-glutamate dehydrogenase, partial [Gammaproteobacteria bacterium]|nr:NAD-glutamate dehydrogenase [Gammaproteobacteria bacterium]